MKIVEISSLSKDFGGHKVFDNFSLTVAKGAMVALVGASGSGKSTLLNIIGALDKPTQGTVSLFGQNNVKPASRKAVLLLRHKIAYLFQNYALIDNETVEDNLKLALRYKKSGNPREEIQQALASVGLADFQDRKVFSLSGGEQQRVAMARVILKPCELILADEPTGNLDENNANEIFSILSQMNKKGKTVIVATHSTNAIKYFDEVVNLDQAK